MKTLSVAIQMKVTKLYLTVVLFIMVQTFETMDEILEGDHSNESY